MRTRTAAVVRIIPHDNLLKAYVRTSSFCGTVVSTCCNTEPVFFPTQHKSLKETEANMFRLADELKRVDSQRRELLREKEQLSVRVNMVQEALERQVEQSVELRKQVRYTSCCCCLLYECQYTASSQSSTDARAPPASWWKRYRIRHLCVRSLYRPVLLYRSTRWCEYIALRVMLLLFGSSIKPVISTMYVRTYPYL